MRRLFLGIIAAFLVYFVSSASAQMTMFQAARAIETGFANVETARLASDCPARDRRLNELANFLAPYVAPTATAFSAAAREEYMERLAEARARPCPPRRVTPPPKSAPGAPAETAPAGSITPTQPPVMAAERAKLLDWIEENRATAETMRLRGDCAEHERLLQAASTFVNQLRQLGALATDLDRLQADIAQDVRRSCPPAPEAARRMNTLAAIDENIDAAERERLRSNCSEHERLLQAATFLLANVRPAAGPSAADRALQARIDQAARRPCPPDAAKPGAGAVPGQKAVPPPPKTPPRISTPPGGKPPICAPNYYQHKKDALPMTCSCTGVEQFSMTWGSNPYRGDSSICNAAIHAGVLPATGIGVVTMRDISGASAALGTTRNGVSTYNWDFAFDSAFAFGATSRPAPEPERPESGRYMTGTFDTSYGPMVLVGGRGSYTDSGGRISPLRIDGAVLDGVWEQDSNGRICSDGRRRGRLRFVFNYEGFTGTWSYCDDPLSGSWSGTRREAL